MTKELLKQALHQMERMLDLCDGLDGEEYDRAHQVMNAIRTHLASPVPEGWVLVPRELTTEIDSAIRAVLQTPDWHTTGLYQAMLAAAPPAAKEQPCL